MFAKSLFTDFFTGVIVPDRKGSLMLTSGQTSADIKVEPRSTFTFRLRVAFHLLSLFQLRTYILRAFAVEINPQ